MEDEFIFQVLEIVAEIPKGKVASYKQIAILANRNKNARLVGKILSHASFYGQYPCHRVVKIGSSLARAKRFIITRRYFV